MRWPVWIGVPLTLAAVVFGIGVVFDGGDLYGRQWAGFVGVGVLLVLVLFGGSAMFAVFGGRLAFEGWRARRGRPFGHHQPVVPDEWGPGRAITTGVLLVVGKGGLCVGFACWFAWREHTANGHIFVMSLWLLTALGVAGLALLALHGWHRRRTAVGKGVLAAVAVVAAVGGWQSFRWVGLWEAARYEWYTYQAVNAHGDYGAWRYWAGRMIAHRPGDWRGYAKRANCYHLGDDQVAVVADIEAAVRLGCDDPSEREWFAACYFDLGRFADAARESDAASAGYVLSPREWLREGATRCATDAAFARLHAGDLSAACEWATARRREKPDDADAILLLAMAHVARGESAAALSLLRPVDGDDYKFASVRLLAWVLATSPEPSVRDIPEARRHIGEYLRRVDVKRQELESNPPKHFRQLQEDLLTENELAAPPILAACSAELGEFDDARRTLEDWKRKTKWDEHLHHGGFWLARCAKLSASVQAGKPYRDTPDK